MERHYRIVLISADGLTGRRGICRVPSEFKPVVFTRVLKLTPIAVESSTPFDLQCEFETREYEFWKAEGRKLVYRERLRR